MPELHKISFMQVFNQADLHLIRQFQNLQQNLDETFSQIKFVYLGERQFAIHKLRPTNVFLKD